MAALNVLLFDEESVLRRAGALMLGARGAHVVTAADTERLVALTARRIYDVLVLELTERGPSAAALLAKIREKGLLPRRVIVCCTRAMSPVEASAFTQVLVKPYPFQALLSAVFGLANRRRPTRSGVFPRVRFDKRPAPRMTPSTPDVAWLARGQVAQNENGTAKSAETALPGEAKRRPARSGSSSNVTRPRRDGRARRGRE
jgi:CheY-like chemotaxis protein